MNILIFIIVLGVLVFVHELGHFLFAKLFRIRVDEFGFGYPPRIKKLGSWKGTDLTLNWIPFGGFVKIFGESDTGEALTKKEQQESLVYKPWWQQLLVLLGGILFNVVFAWLLFAGIYMAGVDISTSQAPAGYTFQESELQISYVAPESPAQEAGLMPGDIVKEYYFQEEVVTVTDESTEDFSMFVDAAGQRDDVVGVVVDRNGRIKSFSVSPELGLVAGRYGIGVAIDRVGFLKLPLGQALVHSARTTAGNFAAVTRGFVDLITGQLSVNNLSGPVGIASQVGQVAQSGFVYLMVFTAMLSLNLAVLNLVPFPALDGGRILIVLIEATIRKRLPAKTIGWVNAAGFMILLLLMLLITVQDVVHLF
jgi:regulator of sigma E protease